MADESKLGLVRAAIVDARNAGAQDKDDVSAFLSDRADELEGQLQTDALHFRTNANARKAQHGAIAILREMAAHVKLQDAPFSLLASEFNSLLAAQQKQAAAACRALGYALNFVDGAYGQGNEMVALLSEITLNQNVSDLVAAYDCPSYFEHAQALAIGDRAAALSSRMGKLGEQLEELSK